MANEGEDGTVTDLVTDVAGAAELDEVVRGLSDNIAPLADYLYTIWKTITPQIMSISGVIELSVIASAGVLGFLFAGLMRRLIERLYPHTDDHEVSRVGRVLSSLAPPILWVVLLWIGTAALKGAGQPNDLARLAASLLNAWIVIRLVSSVVADPFWSRLFAMAAWTVAALNALRLLQPTIALLDGVAVTMGDLRVSLYLVIKAAALAVILLWLATTVARVVNYRVTRAKTLTPSVQTLIVQAVRLGSTLIAI